MTTRPCDASRCGSAARTTAAVPSRLTATTRSQRSRGTSVRRPQASVPAAVTTPCRPPWRSAHARDRRLGRRGVREVDELVVVVAVGRLEVEHDRRAAGARDGVGDRAAETGRAAR